MELHQEGNKEVKLSQISRDRFLFFLLLALITHVFFILNTSYTTKLRSNHPSMEIIFSETKADQLGLEEGIENQASRTETNQYETKPAPELSWKEKANQSALKAPVAKLKKPNAEQLIARSLAQARKHYENALKMDEGNSVFKEALTRTVN